MREVCFVCFHVGGSSVPVLVVTDVIVFVLVFVLVLVLFLVPEFLVNGNFGCGCFL